MADPRFFECAGPFELAEVAARAGGTLVGEADRLIDDVAPLQTAGPREVSFLDNSRYLPQLGQSQAGAIIVHLAHADSVPPGTAAIVAKDPYIAWAQVCALFHPQPGARASIHPTAVIDPEAEVDPSCEIGAHVVVERRARLAAGCVLGAGSVIGQAVEIGENSRIGANCVVSHAVLGARVRLFPGVKIGQDGFGFAPAAAGYVSVPQLGRVILGDDVHVGANTTIDRGSARDTVIGTGTRIDNLVQIGHNVVLGRQCIVVAQVGIAGSTTVGDYTRIGGQAALAGHIEVGRGVQIGAQAGVISDVEPGAVLLGSPAQPKRDFFRQIAFLKRMAPRR
ncbi:UDP-3-O-(3-hydroxymyristoyl)glucosamine N-acyltransferase [Rhizobium rhizosphaerae]|uniref:UDP-3-O-acylglucosamine N-acyltransferase n=1 Tax=Xaviernesmea rhizosphaerae TaxID=1672749 RepID=A0A1Q9ANT2_9HYPH|nr:UDP-3-O-(3-hydroxymyristoyl)glucosamine N-acyltransferase [Xaviernesmea rhizosphaerae]OLP56991.1 UDP-3-O-(3-hydroxymyristoyl)glucosamine N-acyltransferase [Xaviernesmea rhizosphaerae]